MTPSIYRFVLIIQLVFFKFGFIKKIMKLIPSWTAQFCRNLLTCPDVKDSASDDEALEAIVPAPLPLLSVNFNILKMSSYLIDFEAF